jgi:hypothetical protein
MWFKGEKYELPNPLSPRKKAASKISELMEADGFAPIPIGATGYEVKLLEYIEWLKKRQAPIVYESKPTH